MCPESRTFVFVIELAVRKRSVRSLSRYGKSEGRLVFCDAAAAALMHTKPVHQGWPGTL
jgi:hypothetical protein